MEAMTVARFGKCSMTSEHTPSFRFVEEPCSRGKKRRKFGMAIFGGSGKWGALNGDETQASTSRRRLITPSSASRGYSGRRFELAVLMGSRLEAMMVCVILNRMLELGAPRSVAIPR